MCLAIFISLIYVYYKNTGKIVLAIVFSIGMIYLSRLVFVARAQEISFLLFIWEFYWIEKLISTGKKKYSILLIILGILLANFHSSVYPVLFIMYLPYIALILIQKVSKKEFCSIENEKLFWITCGVSLFTGFCSTAGTAPYTDMLKAMKGTSTTFIGELAQSTWSNNKIFYIGIILAFLSCLGSFRKNKLTDVFYLLGFGVMAIYTYRCTYFFWLIAGIAMNRVLSNFIESASILSKTYVKIPVYTSILFVYLLFAFDSVLWIERQEYVEEDLYPVKVADYIEKNIDTKTMRIFNHFNYGSYLEFRGIEAFIDSRSGMFTTEFNPGCTILEDWLKVYNDVNKYTEVFEKYKINYAVVENNEKLCLQLTEDKSWDIIFTDDNFTLFKEIKDKEEYK